jgi:hypothetical protein
LGPGVPVDADQASPHAGAEPAAAQTSSASQSCLPEDFQVGGVGCEVGGVGSKGAVVAVPTACAAGAVVGVGGGVDLHAGGLCGEELLPFLCVLR